MSARWHIAAHEHLECFVGTHGVFHRHAFEHTSFGVHGGFPQLLGVHFTKTFESLHSHILFIALGIAFYELLHLHIGPAIFRHVAFDGAIQWRSGNIEVAVVNDIGYLAIEECHQQGGNVRTVHIGIGHDNDAVVAQFFGVKFLGVGHTKRAEYGHHTFAVVDFVLGHFFHIQYLTA